MELQTLEELLIHELRDLHSAESQIEASLSQLASASSTADVAELIAEYSELVREHRTGLTALFDRLGCSPEGKPCRAIEALVAADRVLIRGDADPIVMDMALLGAVNRMQCYKLAAYAGAELQAAALRLHEVAAAARRCFENEQRAAESLMQLARRVTAVAPKN